MGLGAETCKSVVDKHLCLRGDGGQYDLNPNGTAAKFSRKVPRFWVTLSISSRNRRKTACKKMTKCKQSPLEGCEDLQEQKLCCGG